MKIGLLAILAIVGIALVSFLVFRRASSADVSSPDIRAADAPAAPARSAQDLSVEAHPDAPSGKPVEPRDRTAAAARTQPAPVLESALPPVSDIASDASSASIDGARTTEHALFAAKYATSSMYDRQLARQAIEAVLLAHKSGTEEKGQALTDEQVVELTHEIEWLQAHENP